MAQQDLLVQKSMREVGIAHLVNPRSGSVSSFDNPSSESPQQVTQKNEMRRELISTSIKCELRDIDRLNPERNSEQSSIRKIDRSRDELHRSVPVSDTSVRNYGRHLQNTNFGGTE